MFESKGLSWEVIYGQKKGQHYNHQVANKKEFKWVWRVDDDCIPEPTVLEVLYSHTNDKIGAVGGSILTPPYYPDTKEVTGKIENIGIEANIQWNYNDIHILFLFSCFG